MADFRMPPLSGGERVYRALLHLYPARFRRAFRQDLIETFRDERRNAAQSGVSACAFWLATLRDVMTQGTAERMASAARLLRRGGDDEDSLMSAFAGSLHLAELRVALRRLRRAPSFAITTIVVLALGVGATTAVFSVVNGVLLRPLPYRAPDRLVEITHTVHDCWRGDRRSIRRRASLLSASRNRVRGKRRMARPRRQRLTTGRRSWTRVARLIRDGHRQHLRRARRRAGARAATFTPARIGSMRRQSRCSHIACGSDSFAVIQRS